MLLNKIKFPVGDWSGDGHSQCTWFQVQSNKTVVELREMHFAAKEVVGIEIGEICSDYEDSVLKQTTVDILEANGFIFKEKFHIGQIVEDEGEEPGYYMSAESILNLWLGILQFIDPSFLYQIVSDDEYETINFYGFDGKKRHLNTPGYGISS